MIASGKTALWDGTRQVYMVLSPRSLAYAEVALKSLLSNSLDRLKVHLITDSGTDKVELGRLMGSLGSAAQHRWSVTAEDELNDAEATVFGRFPHLRAFRHGHPCWRKVTDPLLLAAPGSEMILLDPDLYFPNRFRFDATPERGLLLMWQHPNCLLPAEVVRAAMECGIRLARHVDIGVSHWRAGGDLEWLDWLIGKLGGDALPRMMHVEAIVWAAVALREGGGYLDPSRWVCWHRTQSKRVRMKLGAEGASLLATEPWNSMKCFHGGGEAKWWLPEIVRGRADQVPIKIDEPSMVREFVELSPFRYEREQDTKGLLRGLGYYKIFGAKQT